jgi:hypothetical protein
MPKKKETTTMLVRAVRLDVSERIHRYCRREGIRYREFLQRAIDLLEEPNGEPRQDAEPEQEADEIMNPPQRVDEIAGSLKAYKNAIRLLKDLSAILENIKVLGSWNTQANAYLELQRMQQDLYGIIEKYIPDHQIPDDPQEREAMGLPQEYCYQLDLTEEEWAKRKDSSAPAMTREGSPNLGDDASVQEVMRMYEEFKRESREKDSGNGAQPAEDSTEPPDGQEQVQAEAKAASPQPSKAAEKKDGEPQPRKKEIKTTIFGRGFPGVDEE